MRNEICDYVHRTVTVKVMGANGVVLKTTGYGETITLEELFHGLAGKIVTITLESGIKREVK